MSSRKVKSKLRKTAALLRSPMIRRIIPETAPYRPQQLKAMLRRHRYVVAKPVEGTGGAGLIFISPYSRGGYLYRYGAACKRAASWSELLGAVNRIANGRAYLLQQGIRLAEIQGNPVDYRVKLVKRQSSWIITAIVGRVAKPGLSVTNLCRGGKLLPSATAITRSGAGSSIELKQRMRRLARLGTKTLERAYPGIGELGFDFGIDRSGRIWLFEVNTRPH